MARYRSQLLAKTCEALGIQHTFTRRYRPQTNGKAERFVQTCLREWAYGGIWKNSHERTARLPSFLSYYNARRPHNISSNETPSLVQAALHGAGIAMLPTFFVAPMIRAGALVALLPEAEPQILAIHAVYSSRKNMSAAMRAMLDLLAEYFAPEPAWDVLFAAR